jgi:hypothetical protein
MTDGRFLVVITPLVSSAFIFLSADYFIISALPYLYSIILMPGVLRYSDTKVGLFSFCYVATH